MAFYESVFIIRQDISSSDVDKIVGNFAEIVTENGGQVLKTEYWGLRALAYEIGNNTKGHYVFFGLHAEPVTIRELERKMKLSEDVIRLLTIKVNSISSEPSPILRSKHIEHEEVVDVTINKD